ncbi:MAG: hypothetical protein WDZ30_07295 [Cellvibrionaceae bacterium]
MRYLCPNHAQAIRDNAGLAMTLWQGAMENGALALREANWSSARGFFGAAYETALMYLWKEPGRADNSSARFVMEHLVDAGKLLNHALKELGLWEEARICLLTLQSNLLHQAAATPSQRDLAMALTEDYVNQLITNAGLEHRLPHSQSLANAIVVRREASAPVDPDKALH